MKLTTADLRLLIGVGQLREAAAIVQSLQSNQTPARNQCISMDSEKHFAKALFQRFEQLHQECFAISAERSDILLVGT